MAGGTLSELVLATDDGPALPSVCTEASLREPVPTLKS